MPDQREFHELSAEEKEVYLKTISETPSVMDLKGRVHPHPTVEALEAEYLASKG